MKIKNKLLALIAITIILGIIGLIAISWIFGKIYAQVSKVFEDNNKND